VNTVLTLSIVLAALTAASYVFARRKASARIRAVGKGAGLGYHSQAEYHGWFSGIISGGLAFLAMIAGMYFSLGSMITLGIMLALALLGSYFASGRISEDFRARNYVEYFIKAILVLCSLIAVFTTIGIVFSLIFETRNFFASDEVTIVEFITGLDWSAQTKVHEDQVAQSGGFGAVPIFAGTFLITLIAISIAAPIGLMIAIYLSEYANDRAKRIIKPTIEILAGIPTIVYGYFALLTFGPAVRGFAEYLGYGIRVSSWGL